MSVFLCVIIVWSKGVKDSLIAFMFMMLMMLSVTPSLQLLLTSLIEEKNSRVIEVLISSVSPFQLMLGKVLGLTAVGLLNSAIVGALMAGVGWWSGAKIEVSWAAIVLYMVYFVLTFIALGSIYACVGAACNTVKEAQGLLMPMSMLWIIPLFCLRTVATNPNSAVAIALSIMPPLSAPIMLVRVAILPELPWIDMTVSLLLLAASVPCIAWIGGKVFRTGILLYGKTPTIREMLKWMRTD
jgi:ABC-2 type transport system permease protein